MKYLKITILSSILLMTGMACETEGLYESPISVSEHIQLQSGLALRMNAPSKIELLTVSETNIHPKTVFTPKSGERIELLFAGPDRDNPKDLYVVTSPTDNRQTDMSAGFTRIECPQGTNHRYDIGSYFGQAAFSPDGQTAILYHDDNDVHHTEGLFNPNEIAIVNLASPPSPINPQILSIDIKGHTIHDVIFLETIHIGASSHKLAAFIADGLIKLTDIQHPSTETITIKLKSDTDPRTILAEKLILKQGTENRNPTIFALASNSSEIFEIQLFAQNTNSTSFWATLNQHHGGPSPNDFAVIEDNGVLMLAVTNSYGEQVNIIDVSTAAATEIILSDSLDTVTTRNHNGVEELVLWGSNTSHVYFAPIKDLAEEKGAAFENLSVPGGIDHIQALDADRLLIHPYSQYGLIILDMRARAFTHLSSASHYDWNDATLWEDTFFLEQHGHVAFLNLQTGHPQQLVLDETMQQFYVFKNQGIGMALHHTPTGRATLFPLATPFREEAFIIDGFLVGNIFGREVE